MAVLSDDVNVKLCEAVGVDPTDVYLVRISLEAREVATVTIGRYLRDDQGSVISKILKEYDIVPKKKE